MKYRMLNEDDVIKNGDEFFNVTNSLWEKLGNVCEGYTPKILNKMWVDESGVKYRRPIKNRGK